MLEIYETLFNLKFIETKDSQNKSVWHDDVKQIAVWNMDDPKSPNFVGWIYFDLHPRDGKYGHAANFGLSSSFMIDDTTRSYPVTALVCNFSKSTKDKPSLLKHNEIVTFSMNWAMVSMTWWDKTRNRGLMAPDLFHGILWRHLPKC